MPSAARPAAKGHRVLFGDADIEAAVGKTLANISRLVPEGMAAVMATILSSRVACLMSSAAKTFWYCGARRPAWTVDR